MNLIESCTTKDIKLLENIGINVEDRNYTNEEIKKYEYEITDYIMSQSSKNGDIPKMLNQFSGVLNILVKENENG